MSWHKVLKKSFNYGKIKGPPKELIDSLFLPVGEEVPDNERYLSRRQFTLGISFSWLGFIYSLKPSGKPIRRTLRWPFRIEFLTFFRTVFFIDGEWQESLKLGWIVNELIGVAVVNSRAVSRLTIEA